MAEDGFTQANFQAILASSVHDMKNSLSMLLNTFDEIASEYSPEDGAKFERISNLQYQASRVNNDLMKLLSLYKIDSNQYPLHISEHSVFDFLEEQSLRFANIISGKGIKLSVDCDDAMRWYFDQDLLSGVLNDALGNATRYTKSNIQLGAHIADNHLIITVEDDGDGFPEFLLNQDVATSKGINFQSGSTGLGLYFCVMVAKMHNHKGRQGYIKLDNNGKLEGGRFRIFLP